MNIMGIKKRNCKFSEGGFDETFSKGEIGLIDSLIASAIKKKQFLSEAKLNKIFLE